MAGVGNIVFLLDVDNTLIDNDQVEQDLKRYLAQAFGADRQERYWNFFEELRSQLGYADYLGALQRYRFENPRDAHFLEISSFLIDYQFATRLYPGSLSVIERLRSWGTAVILSDGDAVFQPRKIKRSGLWDAVEGHVLIYIHKEKMLDDVERKYPADHYVMVDDKLRILAAMKQVWGKRLTTVFVLQGHYAHNLDAVTGYPPPDIQIERIGDMMNYGLSALQRAR